jgi:hypothetical protein
LSILRLFSKLIAVATANEGQVFSTGNVWISNLYHCELKYKNRTGFKHLEVKFPKISPGFGLEQRKVVIKAFQGWIMKEKANN